MNPHDDEIKKTDEETNISEEEISPKEANTSEEEVSSEVNKSEKETDHPEDESSPEIEEELPDEITIDLEEEFKEEVTYPKEEEAGSEEELRLRMKRRILKSYKWQEDIIIPFSKELDITPEELEEILMKRLDMSSLEALQPRFESSRLRCTREKIHSDLKLCWLSDVMDLLTEEEAEHMKNEVAFKIFKEDKSYEEALEEGRKELVEYLKR